jgi:hypothetical protein
MDGIPVDYGHLLVQRAARIKEQWTGPGKSDILTDLFRKAIAGCVNLRV